MSSTTKSNQGRDQHTCLIRKSSSVKRKFHLLIFLIFDMFLLLTRLFHHHSIRHSSSTREFFANLKKFYRSTTFMAVNNHRTCFVFDQDQSTKIQIQMIYEIPSTRTHRKFNLLRSSDEPVNQTIRRLINNIDRVTKKETKTSSKRRSKDESVSTKQQTPLIQLLDQNDQPIDENLLNKQAWSTSRKLLINQLVYQIEYNAPAVIKFRFPDMILTNTITLALVELDYGDWEHSIFDWYVTDEIKTQETDEMEGENDDIEWTHVHRGPFCVFRDEHVNKFVRLTCLPRNSSLREGMSAEHISKTRIIPCPIDLPMNTRHQLTTNRFPIDSNMFRCVSYNILANGYASSTGAGEIMYPYCPQDYLAHDYRKPLLLKEILGYHADIIALQECDTRFFERELTIVLNEYGYLGTMKIKSENVREGQAIFYRKDRFIAIDSHDITLGHYLRDAEHLESLRQRCALAPEINSCLLERNTALQVLALQLHDDSNEIFLICNTHLYFHAYADVVRCFQAIIACERIREVKEFYEKQNKNVSVLFNGDFNANPTSLTFHFLFTGTVLTDETHRSYSQDYATLIKDFQCRTPVNFSTFSNYAYTNYMGNFHSVLDYIFFDGKNFRFHRAIPMPTHEEVTEFTALPSCKIPSDHLAVVMEIEKIK